MTKIIVVAMQKGGVGKTTTALHLAHGLAALDRDTLLIDADPQASSSDRFFQEEYRGTLADVFGINERERKSLREVIVPTHQPHLFVVPSDSELEKADTILSDQNSDIGGHFAFDLLLRDKQLPFEYVVIDTPPGRSALLMASLIAADEIIMPVQLQPMGFEGFDKIVESTIQTARLQQKIRGEIRLRLRAIVPTFYAQGQLASEALLNTLRESEHPDYEGQVLPVTDPVVQSASFIRASAPVPFDTEYGERWRARTIWEMPSQGESSTVERGRAAYESLARYVDSYA